MEAIVSNIPALPSPDVPVVVPVAVATAAAEPPAIGRGRRDMRGRTVRWVFQSAKRMGVTTVATNSSVLRQRCGQSQRGAP